MGIIHWIIRAEICEATYSTYNHGFEFRKEKRYTFATVSSELKCNLHALLGHTLSTHSHLQLALPFWLANNAITFGI